MAADAAVTTPAPSTATLSGSGSAPNGSTTAPATPPATSSSTARAATTASRPRLRSRNPVCACCRQRTPRLCSVAASPSPSWSRCLVLRACSSSRAASLESPAARCRVPSSCWTHARPASWTSVAAAQERPQQPQELHPALEEHEHAVDRARVAEPFLVAPVLVQALQDVEDLARAGEVHELSRERVPQQLRGLLHAVRGLGGGHHGALRELADRLARLLLGQRRRELQRIRGLGVRGQPRAGRDQRSAGHSDRDDAAADRDAANGLAMAAWRCRVQPPRTRASAPCFSRRRGRA